MSEPYRLTPRGLVVSRALSNAEFESIGRKLGQIASATNWTVGDWLVYGEGEGLPGAKYARAQELTGFTFDVLSQAQRVASAYPMGTRVAGVSWSHHRAALPMPTSERVKALQRAADEGWNSVMVRNFVSRRHAAALDGVALAQTPSPARDAPHRKADSIDWRKNRPRQFVSRKCPKCGHRWEIRTTSTKDAA